MSLAPLGRRRVRVAERRVLGSYVVLVAPDPDGPAPEPGQFYMLAAASGWGGGADERPFLPRAFSVLRAGEDGLEFMLEDVGPGTERLAALEPGDGLWLTGPLGRGFTPPEGTRRAILCGGGVGTAPLALLQDTLSGTSDGIWASEAPLTAPVVLLGFRDGAHAEGADLLEGARVATDDGSVGHHGLVTELLSVELAADPHATVYACGPPAMLDAVRVMCAERDVPAQLALESGMACGFGACFGCVTPLAGGGYARVCVDGPVFAGADLELVPGH